MGFRVSRAQAGLRRVIYTHWLQGSRSGLLGPTVEDLACGFNVKTFEFGFSGFRGDSHVGVSEN